MTTIMRLMEPHQKGPGQKLALYFVSLGFTYILSDRQKEDKGHIYEYKHESKRLHI